MIPSRLSRLSRLIRLGTEIRNQSYPSLTWALTPSIYSRDMPDPTTQSNYLQVYTTNVDFNWNLDFVNQIVEGAATHTILVKEAGVEEVMYINHR